MRWQGGNREPFGAQHSGSFWRRTQRSLSVWPGKSWRPWFASRYHQAAPRRRTNKETRTQNAILAQRRFIILLYNIYNSLILHKSLNKKPFYNGINTWPGVCSEFHMCLSAVCKGLCPGLYLNSLGVSSDVLWTLHSAGDGQPVCSCKNERNAVFNSDALRR